jgi:hypothetical protein
MDLPAAAVKGEAMSKIQSVKPAPRRIYWSVVAAAVVPSLLFVGVVAAIIGAVPRGKPAFAHAANTKVAQVTPEATPRIKVTPADDTAEIRLPSHAPMAVKLSDLPLIASELPEDPLAPLPEAPKPEVAAAIVPAVEAKKDPADDNKDTCRRFGTAVDFAESPMEAFKQATKEKKLTFVLHISGNFEDSKFT